LDPDYPGALDDPELKAYMLRRGLENCACLVRLDSRRAVTVLPPTLTGETKWHIVGGENAGPQWSTWPDEALLQPEKSRPHGSGRDLCVAGTFDQ
jgi:hypothetical protein